LAAISTPCGKSSDGLPIGLQLVAAPFDEERLCSVAQAVEDACGLADEHPAALD
jgi:Asp-tRNA(Asn)/Glu-tRNA(Gln) amidotransferase A subunit family amidase